jgi:hypothetical protein
LSRDRLLIGLAPTRVTLVHLRGMLRSRVVARHDVACSPSASGDAWREPVAAMQSVLAGLRVTAARSFVVLSNHYARYALLPWSSELSGALEEQAYARHHFLRIYGARANGWTLRASAAPPGAPRVAAAVDAGLLEALAASFPKRAGPRLVSVQPYLMAAFNRWRNAFPAAGAWLLLLEPGRACLALQSGGRWRALHNARGSFAAPAELATLLERERHQVDGEAPDLVLLHRGPATGSALQAPGWRLQALPYAVGRFGPELAAA